MTATLSVQPVPPPFVGNLLRNPGFEMGRDWYWVENSSRRYSIVFQDYLAGNWEGGLGGYNNALDYIYQDITIPSGVTNAYVDFFYWITTNETTIYPYDVTAVEIRRPNDNALLRSLVSLSNLNKSSNWVWSGLYDVWDFRGQTIRLKFVVSTDSALPTTFYVDDTGLWVTFLFSDIPSGYWAYEYIMGIYMNCITVGCSQNPLKYCPGDNVNRGQMAAFIVRSKYGENFDYSSMPYFSDVPSTHTFFKYVQKMKDEGITVVSGTYGVDTYVSRGQMAAFIVRAKFGENISYTATPYFSDVPSTHTFFKYVQKMKDAGITAVTGNYMADNIVPRDQMAAFLGRAFLGMQ